MTRAMIPMRDGVKLETVSFTPRDAKGPLPILFMRTPYGAPSDQRRLQREAYAPLLSEGYIVVVQSVRGRFGSEGTFVMSAPPRDRADPRATDDSTDAYDSIEWLIHNVPGNSGRVGMVGTSYDAWTAAMALLDPHPALKAIIEEASPADEFTGDDFRHNGAFRLVYALEYAALTDTSKDENTLFQYDRGDIYDWFLALGPVSNIDRNHFHQKIRTWRDFTEHPNLDAFLEQRAIVRHLKQATIPVLNVGGWWDQEDFYGPLKIYEVLEKNDTARLNHLVVGPWNHGGWYSRGRKLGPLDFGSDTGMYYRTQMQAAWFARYLHGKDAPDQPDATVFVTGANRWQTFEHWPPEVGVTKKRLYLRAGGALAFEPPNETGGAAFDSYVSDPAKPVPFHARPIKPLFSGGQWSQWMVQDQRFVDHRPDVLSFATDALLSDVTVAGELVAELFASTSGSDCDWVVKLIDVYPDGAPPAPPSHPAADAAESEPVDMRGYELMIASKILRGRFRESFSKPTPIPPDRTIKYAIDLHSRAHTFQKGHRIMVQIQSTWFPLIDRNPQRYVDSIFNAKEADFVKATQRVYRSREAPSAIVLPVLSP